MGKGNWRPRTCQTQDGSFADQFYIDISDPTRDDEELDPDFLSDRLSSFDELLVEVAIELGLNDKFDHRHAPEAGGRVLAMNDRVLLVRETGCDIWHVGVGVVTHPVVYDNEDIDEEEAELAAEIVYQKLRDAMVRAFPGCVRIRTSAWTSAVYSPPT